MATTRTPNFNDVILVGGTGRSGTTIVGKLLSRHSQVKLSKPAEIKFLTSGNGLLDLVQNPRFSRNGKPLLGKHRNLIRFEKGLFGKWWERSGKKGGVTGLKVGIDQQSLHEIFSELQSSLGEDRALASAKFFRAFVDYQLQGTENSYWIDTTPPNLMRADEISRLLPQVRFIHMIRDGRDVASSVVREPWGPNNHFAALEWWRERLLKIIKATEAIPDQVKHIWLEDLVTDNREQTLNELLNFLGLDPDEKLTAYFIREVVVDSANIARWSNEVEEKIKFNNRYHQIFDELVDKGLPLPMKQI